VTVPVRGEARSNKALSVDVRFRVLIRPRAGVVGSAVTIVPDHRSGRLEILPAGRVRFLLDAAGRRVPGRRRRQSRGPAVDDYQPGTKPEQEAVDDLLSEVAGVPLSMNPHTDRGHAPKRSLRRERSIRGHQFATLGTSHRADHERAARPFLNHACAVQGYVRSAAFVRLT
jgi:hypothetical protein